MLKSSRCTTIMVLAASFMVNTAQAVQVVAWRSVRTHGGLGAASIPLNPVPTGSGNPTVEPRSGGIQRIEVDFNGSAAPLVASGISVVGVGHNAGGSPLTPVAYALTSATLINSNTTLQINFNAALLPDETCYRIDLGNAIASLTGDTDCYVRALVGDANGSGSLTLADALAVKAKIGQPPLSNAAFDIIPGNSINLSDAIFTKVRIGKLVTCALPSGSCVVTADCTAQDQCHDPGTCNTTTFACSNPIKSNGSGCNDGSACTQSDTCQAGVCVGSNPVVCGGSLGQCVDTCLVACNPATGECGPGIAPNGTACGDVDVCTMPGICQDGACTGMALPDGSPCDDDGNPCTVESCHSGHCVTSNAPDATVCDDGNPCTVVDLCSSGVCVSGRLKNCDDHNDHNFDFCDAATGACMHQADPLDPPCSPNCLVGQRCCRQSTSPGVFTMVCTSFTNACEDAGGTMGTACGGFVCPIGEGCCGGTDCCTPPERCFQGKCLDCTVCGANCCMNGSEICDSGTNTCHPKCGTLGTFCQPSEQCCPNINRCCDATSQSCGNTDCEAAIECPPGFTRQQRPPDQICCLNSNVCGNECCQPALGEVCNECTGHCSPLP